MKQAQLLVWRKVFYYVKANGNIMLGYLLAEVKHIHWQIKSPFLESPQEEHERERVYVRKRHLVSKCVQGEAVLSTARTIVYHRTRTSVSGCLEQFGKVWPMYPRC